MKSLVRDTLNIILLNSNDVKFTEKDMGRSAQRLNMLNVYV